MKIELELTVEELAILGSMVKYYDIYLDCYQKSHGFAHKAFLAKIKQQISQQTELNKPE